MIGLGLLSSRSLNVSGLLRCSLPTGGFQGLLSRSLLRREGRLASGLGDACFFHRPSFGLLCPVGCLFASSQVDKCPLGFTSRLELEPGPLNVCIDDGCLVGYEPGKLCFLSLELPLAES